MFKRIFNFLMGSGSLYAYAGMENAGKAPLRVWRPVPVSKPEVHQSVNFEVDNGSTSVNKGVTNFEEVKMTEAAITATAETAPAKKALTPEQRKLKQERDRRYKANKKIRAAEGPAPIPAYGL